MGGLTFLATPLPYLPASSIRYDFKSLVSLLQLLTQWLDLGIMPKADSETSQKVNLRNTQSICKLPYFPRGYINLHGSEIIDISKLCKHVRPEISNAYAYGDLLEISYKNVKIKDFLPFLNEPDLFFTDIFLHNSKSAASLFKLYVDKEVLEDKQQKIFTVFFTSYLALLFTGNVNEFEKLKKTLKLRELVTSKIAIGVNNSTNFLNGPFRYINDLPINPILVLVEDDPDYKSVQTMNVLLGSLICGGELYNLVQLIEGLATILSLSKFTVRHEIFSKVGKIRLNLFSDVVELYGLKPLKQMERNYIDFKDNCQYIMDYGGIESELTFRTYGFSYFEGIITLCDLFHSYIRDISKLISAPKFLPKDFHHENIKYINHRIEELQKILVNLDEMIEKLLADARTTVQINLAIMALIVNIIISILSFLFNLVV